MALVGSVPGVVKDERLLASGFDRVCGALLVAGSLVCIVAHVMHPAEPRTPAEIPVYMQHTVSAHVVLFLGSVAVLCGLPGLFARLSRRTGVMVRGRTMVGRRTMVLVSMPLLLFGLALADLMHSPIEFGALSSAYAAAPEQIARIYLGMRSTPFGLLTTIGNLLVLVGTIVFCFGSYGVRGLYRVGWIALAGSAVCMVLTQVGVPVVNIVFPLLFYVGWLVDGVALFRTDPDQARGR